MLEGAREGVESPTDPELNAEGVPGRRRQERKGVRGVPRQYHDAAWGLVEEVGRGRFRRWVGGRRESRAPIRTREGAAVDSRDGRGRRRRHFSER